MCLCVRFCLCVVLCSVCLCVLSVVCVMTMSVNQLVSSAAHAGSLKTCAGNGSGFFLCFVLEVRWSQRQTFQPREREREVHKLSKRKTRTILASVQIGNKTSLQHFLS